MRRSVCRAAIPFAIVMGLAACDNVEWEGLDVRLDPPAERDVEVAPAPPEDEDAPPPPLDLGPLVYLLERTPDGDEAVLHPVAELPPGGGELRPLPSGEDPEGFAESFAYHHFHEGDEFVLLSGGRRAGTLVADGETGLAEGFCPPRPWGSGRTELVGAAQDHERFLAVRKDEAGDVAYGALPPADPGAAMADASETAAAPLMMDFEAPWPPSMAGIRQALALIAIPPRNEELLAATFVYNDELVVGSPPANAYSLFFLAGRQDGEGPYRAVHASYRRQDDQGKAWPDPVDFLPWEAVAGGEALAGPGAVLVGAFGEAERWFYALEPDPAGGWEMTFRDPCEPYLEE